MSVFICKCVDNLFNPYDYNNLKIKKKLLKQHNSKENAWICINDIVYSIRKDDLELLKLFENFYGKIINNFFKQFDVKNQILIFEKLKKRKIGILVE